jgi:hypothetical protein
MIQSVLDEELVQLLLLAEQYLLASLASPNFYRVCVCDEI